MGETKINRLIYNHSPVFIQNAIASVYGWQKNRYRYGSKRAKEWFDFYKETENWDERKKRNYQSEQLQKIIHYAYNHVPFYKKRFDKNKVKPEDIKKIEDLQKLPYLTKDEIRNAGNDLISDEYKRKELFIHPTSGSTGTPLTLYADHDAVMNSFNFAWATCRPGLIRNRHKYAHFTGLEIVKPDISKPPFWRMNYASRQRLYSIFHMSDTNIPYYLDDFVDFKPVWFQGYPSAIYTLAEYIIRHNYDYPYPPKAVITSAEECLPEYRQAIEKAFKTRVWDEYGQGEMCAFAFECECRKLHEKIVYSVIEFIPVGQENGLQICELICTSFINKAWPLIRYRVGDLALINPDAKCPLGRTGRVIERIYGRTAHRLLTSDGAKITNISVMAKKCRNVRFMQAIQKEKGKVILHVVPDPNFDKKKDEILMVREFRKKLGDEKRMEISVEYAERPVLTSSGKMLMIISELTV